MSINPCSKTQRASKSGLMPHSKSSFTTSPWGKVCVHGKAWGKVAELMRVYRSPTLRPSAFKKYHTQGKRWTTNPSLWYQWFIIGGNGLERLFGNVISVITGSIPEPRIIYPMTAPTWRLDQIIQQQSSTSSWTTATHQSYQTLSAPRLGLQDWDGHVIVGARLPAWQVDSGNPWGCIIVHRSFHSMLPGLSIFNDCI